MKHLTILGVFLSAGAVLGCGNDAQTSQPATERTATSAQQLNRADLHPRLQCPDPPPDPPPVNASDCGATDTTPCNVTSAFTSGSFSDLQSAINAVSDGDVLTVTGMCPAATMVGRTNLTIQGNFPPGGCGFSGPSGSTLSGEVQGLDIVNSINISVRNLNFVNSTMGSGIIFDQATTPLVSCVCTAFNSVAGIVLGGVVAAVVSQTLDEANTFGILSEGTQTIVIANNTVTANTDTGILLSNATNNNVSFNSVTNNGVNGILFVNTTQSLATGNTIRGNGDELVDLIACSNSQAFGSNVPPGCMGF